MGVFDSGQGVSIMVTHRLSAVGVHQNQISHAQHVWCTGYRVIGRVRWEGNKLTAPFKPSSVRLRTNSYPHIMRAHKEWHMPIVVDCLRCWAVWHKRKGQKVSA